MLRTSSWILSASIALCSTAAFAQAPNGLVLRDSTYWWSSGCPNPTGGATEQEFIFQGIPVTTVNSAGFASVDFYDYTMIFVPDCQPNTVYDAWNARQADLEKWIKSGGFVAVHATRNCSGASVQAQIPGGTPTQMAVGIPTGVNLEPAHPIMANLPANPVGSSLAHDSYTNTGNPADLPLIKNSSGADILLFERQLGRGTIIYGGLTYECYSHRCGSCGAGHAGQVLVNEVTWGSTFTLCGDFDSDGDGVGDDCDICDGGDDEVDTDLDGVPDDCDRCPNLAWPDDLDGDGICDDVDDSDEDGIVDLHDLCPQVYDPDQLDRDGDGWGDACDECPMNPQAGPRMLEWFVDADGDGQGVPGDVELSCTRPPGRADNPNDCDDTNKYVRQGAPEVCDGLDNNCDGVVDFAGCAVEGDTDLPPTVHTGSGCATGPASPAWLLLLGAGLAVRRRR